MAVCALSGGEGKSRELFLDSWLFPWGGRQAGDRRLKGVLACKHSSLLGCVFTNTSLRHTHAHTQPVICFTGLYRIMEGSEGVFNPLKSCHWKDQVFYSYKLRELAENRLHQDWGKSKWLHWFCLCKTLRWCLASDNADRGPIFSVTVACFV